MNLHVKKNIVLLLLLACFCLNTYSCFDIRSKQNNNEVDSRIQEFEELIIKYSFYKNYITDNNLSIEIYSDILFSDIKKMKKIADYLYNKINENLPIIIWQS